MSWKIIQECDAKTVNALDYILTKCKIVYIPLPIKLIHSDIVTNDEARMSYAYPNTVIVDDSTEFVQYMYNASYY